MTTAYAFVPSPQHMAADHPEHPSRFDLLAPRLDSFGAQRLTASAATREEIARVHHPDMIASLEDACRRGSTTIIDPAPTFVTPTSFQDALLAAGAVLDCTRAVVSGSAQNAFGIIRPPGHHAEPARAMGFCIFNNVAVAARDLLVGSTDGNWQPLRRVAIVDYDAHHGNGTQAAFIDEERVAYLSTHQWGIYPGTGWFEEAPQARKRILNVPLQAGSGDKTYQRVADEIIVPFIQSFKPEMILVSAGFDAHWNDPITSLGLSTAGFHSLSKQLVHLAEEHCKGRIVFVLEGGYDPTNVANGAAAVFSALTDGVFTDPGDVSPYKENDGDAMIEKVRRCHGF